MEGCPALRGMGVVWNGAEQPVMRGRGRGEAESLLEGQEGGRVGAKAVWARGVRRAAGGMVGLREGPAMGVMSNSGRRASNTRVANGAGKGARGQHGKSPSTQTGTSSGFNVGRGWNEAQMGCFPYSDSFETSQTTGLPSRKRCREGNDERTSRRTEDQR